MSASTTSDTHSVSSGVSHNSSTASGAHPVVQNPFEAVLPSNSNDPFATVILPPPPTMPQVSASMQSPMKFPLPTTAAVHPSPSSVPSALPQTSPPPATLRSIPLDVRSPAPISISTAATNIIPAAPVGGGLSNAADMLFDDDENTAPSSLGNATDNDTQQSSEPMNRFTSRFIESTKRFMSNNNAPLLRKDSDEPVLLMASGADSRSTTLIAGYLQKLGRNGKWQTRWFETNGEFLSYYKSSKRSKLLATLDLQKVGLIEIDSDDRTEHSFRIQVLGRLYHLRANSRASCHDWVITLNRVKEARMQQGNVKLVGLPTTTTAASLATSALDLLHSGGKSSNPTATAVAQPDGTPRVVVVSNRERTRAVDEEEQWDQLIRVDPHTLEMDVDPVTGDSTYAHNNKRLSSFSTVVAARWTKHQSSLQRVGTKLSKWARSVKKYSCANVDGMSEAPAHLSSYGGGGVQLDKYLHPPGHDDKKITKAKVVVPPHYSVKPDPVKDRALSTASDYDSRMLS